MAASRAAFRSAVLRSAAAFLRSFAHWRSARPPEAALSATLAKPRPALLAVPTTPVPTRVSGLKPKTAAQTATHPVAVTNAAPNHPTTLHSGRPIAWAPRKPVQ